MLTDAYQVSLKARNGRETTLLLRRCDAGDLSTIVQAQDFVISSLGRQHIFARTSEDEIAESLKTDFCIGAFSGSALAAFTLMVRNRKTPRNLGAYLGYSDEMLLRCVTYDTTFVLPSFRGYSIQRFFCKLRDEAAVEMGAAVALATVSPDNTVSLNNIMANGFEILTEKIMYTGVPRYIVGKKLVASTAEKGAINESRHLS